MKTNQKAAASTCKHPLGAALEAFHNAPKGCAASFHWENGHFVKPLWIGKQPKRLQGRCNAKCRDGHLCRARVIEGRKRCRNHGGLSTGPKTSEGRAAIGEANRQRAERKQKREANRAELIQRGLEVAEEIERRQRDGLR